MAKAPKRPIQLRKAMVHMGRLLENPEDTGQVFHIIEALSGNSHFRLVRRVERQPDGARLLRDRPDLLELLQDRHALRRLPEGSLGRAYLDFVESEGITAEGLVDASQTGSERPDVPPELAAKLEYMGNRMRDTHDLWHTVTGYKGDLIGEACVLAFSFGQTWNPGVGFIVAVAWFIEGGRLGARSLITEALKRSLAAEPLPPQPWEDLLALPLDEVRRRLNVSDPPVYQPVRSHEVDVLAGVAA